MNDCLFSILNAALVMDNEELIDFYKDLAATQSNQFTILVTVIGVVFTVVVGATWWWNYRGAKSQINDDMNAARNDFSQLMSEMEVKFNSFKTEMQESMNDMIEKSIDSHLSLKLTEYTEQIERIDKKNEEKLNDFQDTVNRKITAQQAELNRVFALHCKSVKAYYNAFIWWLDAFELYNNIDDGKLAQISIKAAIKALKQVKKEDVTDKEELTSYADRIKNIVPDILSSERKELLELIDKICYAEKE